MNSWLSWLLRPWILLALVISSLLLSLSFSVRFAREETAKVRRLESTLAEIRRLRMQVAAPAEGLPLLSHTGVQSPLRGMADPTLGYVSLREELSSVSLGMGLERRSVSLSLNQLDPDRLGELFASMEGETLGWWITGISLRASGNGLDGHVTVEALDKVSADP
jgi:hypothetical protein